MAAKESVDFLRFAREIGDQVVEQLYGCTDLSALSERDQLLVIEAVVAATGRGLLRGFSFVPDVTFKDLDPSWSGHWIPSTAEDDL